MPEPPGPDDRLGFSLVATWEKVDGGYRGSLVGIRSGRWEWTCRHEPPHPSPAAATECAKDEIKGRRSKLA